MPPPRPVVRRIVTPDKYGEVGVFPPYRSNSKGLPVQGYSSSEYANVLSKYKSNLGPFKDTLNEWQTDPNRDRLNLIYEHGRKHGPRNPGTNRRVIHFNIPYQPPKKPPPKAPVRSAGLPWKLRIHHE